LTVSLILLKKKFELDPIACIITDTDSRIHKEVRKIFPGIVIKVPVFYIIRTIAQRCRLETSEAADFAEIIYQEGLYEKTGTIPTPPDSISDKLALAVAAADVCQPLWTHIGQWSSGLKGMWKLLWSNDPHGPHQTFLSEMMSNM